MICVYVFCVSRPCSGRCRHVSDIWSWCKEHRISDAYNGKSRTSCCSTRGEHHRFFFSFDLTRTVISIRDMFLAGKRDGVLVLATREFDQNGASLEFITLRVPRLTRSCVKWFLSLAWRLSTPLSPGGIVDHDAGRRNPLILRSLAGASQLAWRFWFQRRNLRLTAGRPVSLGDMTRTHQFQLNEHRVNASIQREVTECHPCQHDQNKEPCQNVHTCFPGTLLTRTNQGLKTAECCKR